MRAARVIAALVMALTATVVAPPSPAEAESAGTVEFSGEAVLPKFPCPVPLGEIPCQGTFSGVANGTLTGRHQGTPWTVTLANAPMTASYGYSDAVADCTFGQANGTASINAAPLQTFGTYDAGPLPATVSEMRAALDFAWQRIGTSATIQVFNADLELKVNLPGGAQWIKVTDDSAGRAAAGFIPEFDPNDLPDCQTFTNSPPITALVRGTAALEQA